MEMVLSSQVTDKEEYSRFLEELLKELPERQLNRETGTRLMTVGSPEDAARPRLEIEINMADLRDFDMPRTLARIESFLESLGCQRIAD